MTTVRFKEGQTNYKHLSWNGLLSLASIKDITRYDPNGNAYTKACNWEPTEGVEKLELYNTKDGIANAPARFECPECSVLYDCAQEMRSESFPLKEESVPMYPDDTMLKYLAKRVGGPL